jgi:hypothetical protein
MGDGMKLGQGGRFKKFTGKLESEGYSAKSAGAIAASAGRKKYGAKKFNSLGAKARKSSFYGG